MVTQNNFKVQKKTNLLSTIINKWLLKSITVKNYIECISACVNSLTCPMAILSQNTNCNIYIQTYLNQSMFTTSPDSDIYFIQNYQQQSINITSNLVSYWTFDNNLFDYVTGNWVINGTGYSFVNDRHGRQLSAILFGLILSVFFEDRIQYE